MGVIHSFLHRMATIWIRNDFRHHAWTKISKDKVLFNKEKNKHSIGGEANVNVGVEPVNVGLGAAFNKKQADEREGLLYQDIQLAGFTRLDKGTEQTKDFKVDGNNYPTIIVHKGDWKFHKIMDNEELGNKDKNIRINKGGAIVYANWTHKYLNYKKEKYAEEYSWPPPIPVDQKMHPIQLWGEIPLGVSESKKKVADTKQLYKNCLEEWIKLDDNMEKIKKFKDVITKWEDFETANNQAMSFEQNPKSNEEYEMLAKQFEKLFSSIHKASEDMH